MKRLIFVGTLLSIGVLLSSAPSQTRETKGIDEWDALELSLRGEKSVRPGNGFVPDAVTASRIGEAVAAAYYGEGRIARERPFRARLRGDVWMVKGTLHPQGALGGTAVLKIDRKTGAVLFMTHQY
jgi:hypothetical protein